MLTLQQINDHILSAPTSDLHNLLNVIHDTLRARENKATGFVDYIPDFCSDSELLAAVREECDQLKLKPSGRDSSSPGTQWLSTSSEPYIYSDSDPVHNALPISSFPSITKLLDLVNLSTEVVGPLDSCHIVKYESDNASLRLHADDEPFIDQNKTICAFTLGCDRTIEFYTKSKRPKHVIKFRMEENGMVIMRPGAQQNLKHCVRAEVRNSVSDKPQGQVRYSLSFRARAVKDPSPASNPVPPSSPESPPTPIPSASAPSVAPQKQKEFVSLIAGDSFAARMDTAKLGKKRIEVVNLAQGGKKMKDVTKQLEEHKARFPEREVVKIIISVGTNDLRNENVTRDVLKGQFKHLCTNIKRIYPNSRVFFQSLLPLPLKHQSDWSTNRRVIDLNNIIFRECSYRNFYFIDVFFSFCKYSKKHNEPISRFDRNFEENGIHPNSGIGMGILARNYIFALHKFGKQFHPCIFQ